MSARTDLDYEAWDLLTELAETLDHDQARSLVERHRALVEGSVDGMLARWQALKPRVEALGPDDALDEADLKEAISVARAMDQAGDPAYDEARAWFKANNLPTNWQMSPPAPEQHRTTDRR